MGMRRKKQIKGMEPATANVRPSQSSLSIRFLGERGRGKWGVGRGVSKGRPLILRLQSIKLLNFNLILVVKSKVKISYSG